MRDWKRYVREHLPLAEMRGHPQGEIVEEIAGQMEEAYREALAAGATEEQANAAAERLLKGAEAVEPFAPVPFVWSDQYDRKIQSAGRFGPEDEVRIVHGSLAERRFVALHGRGGRLVGAVAMNRVRQLMAFLRRIREGIGLEEAVAEAEAAG